ncbi:MAG: UDP-N-acetylmuramoyl-tripeptide--D-alanyl-D-alanine ligase [Caldanaerobacter sp.]
MSYLFNIFDIFAVLAFVFAVFFYGRKELHMAQLEGYKIKNFFKWHVKNWDKWTKESSLFLIGSLIVFLLDYFLFSSKLLLLIPMILFVYATYKEVTLKKRPKKPLVFTARATRLFTTFWLFMGLSLYFTLKVYFKIPNLLSTGLLLIAAFVPVYMLFSLLVTYPLEMFIQMLYYKSAQRKIRSRKDLITIGITGSYGKTSTKHFITAILSERFSVLMTPESYNTPMGVTKVIRNDLKDSHQIFVCEMGARQKGDIKVLVKLANPKIGVITSIGPQHLETFGTIENVARTKFELIEGLPEDGIAVLNGDNYYCRTFGEKFGVRKLFYGVENPTERNYFLWAENIINTKQGLKFDAVTEDGKRIKCEVPLLGRHNVSNLLAAISVAIALGMEEEEIRRGLLKVEPVPHRLQLISTPHGVTIIDDAFNSNPEGAKEALACLKEMDAKRRIIVTPGMVELGDKEYEENKNLGENIAEVCDYAILVGKKRSRPIFEGLKEASFPEEKVFVVANLDEATKVLQTLLQPGDVVLFENDLPDNYEG